MTTSLQSEAASWGHNICASRKNEPAALCFVNKDLLGRCRQP